MTAINKPMVNIPLDELKRTINVLRYAAHPYPSPHADYWEEFLAKAPAQHQGEIVKQWSDDGLLWADGEENEMASARAEGYMTRTLYLHSAEQHDIGTDSDKYKAELYDEVWARAKSMGFMNVTMALEKLVEKPAPVAVLMPDRMNEADAVQKLLGRFGVYGMVPANVATDIYNAALDRVKELNAPDNK